MRAIRLALISFCVALVAAVLASPALALSTNNPQFHRCELGGSGLRFTNSTCTEESSLGEYGEEILESGSREFKASGTSVEFGPSAETIRCKNISASESKVIGASSEGRSGAEAKLDFEDCEVVGSPSCEINSTKSGTATIASESLSAVIDYATQGGAEIEEGNAVIVFKPASGTTLATFKLSGSCSSAGTFHLEGDIALEDVSGSEHSSDLLVEAPSSGITKAYYNGEKSTRVVEIPRAGVSGHLFFVCKGKLFLPDGEPWWLSTI